MKRLGFIRRSVAALVLFAMPLCMVFGSCLIGFISESYEEVLIFMYPLVGMMSSFLVVMLEEEEGDNTVSARMAVGIAVVSLFVNALFLFSLSPLLSSDIYGCFGFDPVHGSSETFRIVCVALFVLVCLFAGAGTLFAWDGLKAKTRKLVQLEFEWLNKRILRQELLERNVFMRRPFENIAWLWPFITLLVQACALSHGYGLAFFAQDMHSPVRAVFLDLLPFASAMAAVHALFLSLTGKRDGGSFFPLAVSVLCLTVTPLLIFCMSFFLVLGGPASAASVETWVFMLLLICTGVLCLVLRDLRRKQQEGRSSCPR